MEKRQVLCQNGHNFDASKITNCPFCGAPPAVGRGPALPGANAENRTADLAVRGFSAEPVTQPIAQPVAQLGPDALKKEPPTRPLWWNEKAGTENDGNPAKGRVEEKADEPRHNPAADPAVGWLLNTEGPARGWDYRICTGNNSIGRSPDMRICISGDESISRDKHAFIIYDPKGVKFILRPGDTQGLVYLNGDLITGNQELNPYDIIELGQSKLLFIPACGEKFKW